ncbi:MAG: PfkB family carbohydrate kinase, partial [Planctomycetota bacterium]
PPPPPPPPPHPAPAAAPGPNIATGTPARGHGARAPVVFYNRANEAAAMLGPGDIDWPAIFAGGVRWFHSGGIYAALGEKTSDLIAEGMQAAKAAGAVTSFDLNYRAKLWKTLPGGESRGVEMNRQIAQHLDVLIGNEEDLQKGLGLAGQDVEKASKLDPEAFFAMIEQVKAEFPNVKLVATTLREVHSTSRHGWSAVLWRGDADGGGERFTCPTMSLDVIDRIGGGDGFASGLIYGTLADAAPERALRLGWAHGALLTTYPGDVSQASLAEVEALADGGSARVQR